MSYINNPNNFYFLVGLTIVAILFITFLVTALFYVSDDYNNQKQVDEYYNNEKQQENTKSFFN